MTDQLSPGRRRLVELSAALAAGDPDAREKELAAAARAVSGGTLPQRAVEEAILQSHLFLGYPASLTALASWRVHREEVPEERDPLADPGSPDAWRERGSAVCRRVYGRAYAPLRKRVSDLHPAMDRWMVADGYGKVLGRPGLDLSSRELCIVAILAVGAWRPQLHSHLRGALRVGAPPGSVEEALERGLRRGPGEPWDRDARRLWSRVRDRVETSDDPTSP